MIVGELVIGDLLLVALSSPVNTKSLVLYNQCLYIHYIAHSLHSIANHALNASA